MMTKLKILIAKTSVAEINIIEDELKVIEPSIIFLKADTHTKAIEFITSENPNIVVMDINMIDSEGNNILSVVNDWNFDAIIKTSGRYYKIHKDDGKDLGYILKPIEIDSLINKCLKNM